MMGMRSCREEKNFRYMVPIIFFLFPLHAFADHKRGPQVAQEDLFLAFPHSILAGDHDQMSSTPFVKTMRLLFMK